MYAKIKTIKKEYKYKVLKRQNIQNPYILALGISEYPKEPLPGVRIDIQRIKKLFNNVNLFGYPTIDICQPWLKNENKKKGFITKQDIWEWLEIAKANIYASFIENHMNLLQNKPFDAIIFYISCHGSIDCSFVEIYSYYLLFMPYFFYVFRMLCYV